MKRIKKLVVGLLCMCMMVACSVGSFATVIDTTCPECGCKHAERELISTSTYFTGKTREINGF